jgi:hypothetical protein
MEQQAKATTMTVALSHVTATPGALEALVRGVQSPAVFLARHQRGDLGEVSPADWQANERALRTQERLLSVYRTAVGERLWIITEADRSVTTLLLPEEY